MSTIHMIELECALSGRFSGIECRGILSLHDQDGEQSTNSATCLEACFLSYKSSHSHLLSYINNHADIYMIYDTLGVQDHCKNRLWRKSIFRDQSPKACLDLFGHAGANHTNCVLCPILQRKLLPWRGWAMRDLFTHILVVVLKKA